MSEQPTEYGKALVEACARAAYEACPATNITTREPISWEDRSPIAKHVEVLRVRAALLAACAKLKEPSQAMLDAAWREVPARIQEHMDSDDIPFLPIFRAMLSQLLTEIGM